MAIKHLSLKLQQLHSHFGGKEIVVFAGKLRLISDDRAPLVARLLIAESLMWIISDMEPFSSCRQLQLQYCTYLVFFLNGRETEGI